MIRRLILERGGVIVSCRNASIESVSCWWDRILTYLENAFLCVHYKQRHVK